MLQLRAAQAFGRVLMTGCLEDDAPSLNDLIWLQMYVLFTLSQSLCHINIIKDGCGFPRCKHVAAGTSAGHLRKTILLPSQAWSICSESSRHGSNIAEGNLLKFFMYCVCCRSYHATLFVYRHSLHIDPYLPCTFLFLPPYLYFLFVPLRKRWLKGVSGVPFSLF